MGSPSEQATTKAGGRSHPECHPLADNSDKKRVRSTEVRMKERKAMAGFLCKLFTAAGTGSFVVRIFISVLSWWLCLLLASANVNRQFCN